MPFLVFLQQQRAAAFGACRPFDGMPRGRRAKKARASIGEDRISALPDTVLQHVLGFLPADEAVRTSVLARRWMHLWKSVRRLRITPDGERWKERPEAFIQFVNRLLLLRQPGSPLDEFEISGYPFSEPAYDVHVHLWTRQALLCQALAVHLVPSFVVVISGPPLASRLLRELKFRALVLIGSFLDFASCPALEDLQISHCDLYTDVISSQSLKHLSIWRTVFRGDTRTRISAPNLVSLKYHSFHGKSPLLERMPSLETASVKLNYGERDSCYEGPFVDGNCAYCCGDDEHKGACMLLGGLSSATNLELCAEVQMFIFRRDLRWCPTFSKLKTLLLNEWCMPVDLRALVCILKHSPVLENLTLQLHKGPKHTMEIEGKCGLMKKPAGISEHLKIVKVKCEQIDDRVSKILKFLTTFDIEIIIKRVN